MALTEHQYIDRTTGQVRTERPFADPIVNFFYSSRREQAPYLYYLLGSQWVSGFLGWLNYDFPFGQNISGIRRFLRDNSIDLSECVNPPESFDSARKVFERQIRYWDCRPTPADETAVVCPADSRIVLGSLKDTSSLFLKGKFFNYDELLGIDKNSWLGAFHGGDYVICRLTPEKYHYNHTPVAGIVRDHYECDGAYHSCNPGAVVTVATPYSKNKRVVTVIDTDVAGGTQVGLVAMVEVVALMIGAIVQCYSPDEYRNAEPIKIGMFLDRGRPKSLFRPGSSTTVLLFRESRVAFCADLIGNLRRGDLASRYSQGLGKPLVETDIKVRAAIGWRNPNHKEDSDDF